MKKRALVIGSGVNELVAAHMLARAGYAVLLFPEVNTTEDESGWLAPRIVRALSLKGLRVRHADPWAVAPLPQGGRLELWRDLGRSVESIRKLSPRDAAKWPEFCARMARLARFLEAIYLSPPPDPLSLKSSRCARGCSAAELWWSCCGCCRCRSPTCSTTGSRTRVLHAGDRAVARLSRARLRPCEVRPRVGATLP